jgi:hypothetical protein
MMRRRKLRLARASPPPWRSDGVLLCPKKIAADRLIHPDMSGLRKPGSGGANGCPLTTHGE